MQAWDEDRDFRTLVFADPEISSRLDATALESVFDLEATVQHVDIVFERLQALAQRGEAVHV
jgi:adenylosuccinate lyase